MADDEIRAARLLYVLATDPARVLPQGKSILSMLMRPPSVPPPSTLLEEHVRSALHRTFWDEAALALSSPDPPTVLKRLQFLCSDLRDATAPLLPQFHPAFVSLSKPPPTSSPLHSALVILSDVLLALRQRCAPIRDPNIDRLLVSLDVPPPNGLASLVVDTFRSLIALAGILKGDLSQALLGSMSDADLAGVIKQQASVREREIVLRFALVQDTDTISSSGRYNAAVEQLRRQWHEWVQPSSRDWISRLMQALTTSVPVSCYDTSPNTLPLQFFFAAPDMLYAQNYLQALVICASLRALIQLPGETGAALDFIPRVWALLKGEMDAHNHPTQVPGSDDLQEAHTKLINLADEVIRARRTFIDHLTDVEETNLRAAVERVLRLTDPVFVLLMGRLSNGIAERVRTRKDMTGNIKSVSAPKRLRAGRGKLFDHEHSNISSTPHVAKLIKGFESVTLTQQIAELVRRLSTSVDWLEEVWADTI